MTVKLFTVFVLTTALVAPVNCLAVSRAADAQEPAALQSRIEFLPVPDLPLSMGVPTIKENERGYTVTCSAANYSTEQILGATFLLLIADPDNRIRGSVSWTQRIKVAAGATQDLSFRIPINLHIRVRDRAILALEQVYGHDSIWQTLKVRESAEAYAKGDSSAVATVQRNVNKFDPRQPVRVIY